MILKTEPPALPHPHVARPALVDRVLHHRVTLLSAPAGYGKSVLLAEVLHRAGCPIALYQLHPSDRAPGRLPVAINDLMGGWDPTAAHVLAIDGLEALQEATDAWSALNDALATAPENCRLILAGRVLAPLPALSRLRLEGQVLSLGPRDLLFSEAESQAFLAALAPEAGELERLADDSPDGAGGGDRLADDSPDGAGSAIRLAGGWPAALRLLAAQPSCEELCHYVEREVAAPLSQEERHRLTDFAVVTDWTPQTCNWLLERSDGEELLAHWKQMLPVDRRGDVHLLVRRCFASLLDQDAVRRRTLHRRAALLEMERSNPAAALAHALNANDIGLSAPLLQQVVGRLLADGRLEHLDAWLERTPAPVLEASPELLLNAGEALRRGGRPRRGAHRLHMATLGFAAEGDSGGLLRSLCRLALTHADLGEWGEMEAALRQVEAEAPSTSGRDRAEAMRTLAEYQMWLGQSEAAAGRFGEALQLFRAHADQQGAGTALLGLGAGPLVALGRLDEAVTALRESQALLGGAEGCEAALAEARILLEQDRWQEASVTLATARPRTPQQQALLLWAHAQVSVKRNDVDTARRLRKQGEESLAAVERTPLLRGEAFLLEGWLALAEGDVGLALSCGRQASRLAPRGLPLLRHSAHRLIAAAETAVDVVPRAATATAARSVLRVTCFGAFQLFCGHREVPLSHWGRAQVRTVLQCLVLQPGFSAPRDLLLETLWPEANPEQSRARLRVILNRLRQTLHQLGVSLEASADVIRIPHEAIASVDILTFRQHLAAARGLAADAPDDCLGQCRAGRALCRGVLLQDAFWPGVEVHRRQAHAELVELLQLWQEAAVRAGRMEEAITVLEELVALEPGHEEAARRLISQLIQCGRRGEAAHRYRALARWLKAELGLDPSPETRALFHQTLR